MKFILKPIITSIYFILIIIINYSSMLLIFLVTLIWFFNLKKALEITKKETEHDSFHEGEEFDKDGNLIKFHYKHPWHMISGKKVYK